MSITTQLRHWPKEPKIVAVVVTFYPEISLLIKLLNSLLCQVSDIVVVDNGSREDVKKSLAQKHAMNVHCVLLGQNTGIATAHNCGIKFARQLGADYVILFDQDSEPTHDMVSLLLNAWRRMTAQGHKVAAVGPRYIDDRQKNPPPFIRVKGLNRVRGQCETPDCVVPVDYLVSSGCLMPMTVLNDVGGMRDDFFIDYVDIEWGLRAKNRGYQSFGFCGAKMRHSLGDCPIEFFGRKLPLHSPLRHYYHFRNAIWMYKQKWLPLNWKIVDGRRLLLKYGFYTLFAKPRHKHWWMMTLGIWHGLVDRMGQLDS